MGIFDIILAGTMVAGGIFCLTLAIGLTILNPLLGIPVCVGYFYLFRWMKKRLDKYVQKVNN